MEVDEGSDQKLDFKPHWIDAHACLKKGITHIRSKRKVNCTICCGYCMEVSFFFMHHQILIIDYINDCDLHLNFQKSIMVEELFCSILAFFQIDIYGSIIYNHYLYTFIGLEKQNV